MADLVDVPLIDGRRWFAWDGTELWALLAPAIEPSDWPERLGDMLAVEDVALGRQSARRAVIGNPREGTGEPVLVYLVEPAGQTVVVSRPEHVAALLVFLHLPAR